MEEITVVLRPHESIVGYWKGAICCYNNKTPLCTFMGTKQEVLEQLNTQLKTGMGMIDFLNTPIQRMELIDVSEIVQKL